MEGLGAEVLTQFTRNEAGRLRIGGMKVRLLPKWTEETATKAQRCVQLFEDFCVVTQAIRQGVPVEVQVDGMPSAAV